MDQEVYYILAGDNNTKVGFLSAADYSQVGASLGVAKALPADEVIILRVGDMLKSGQMLRMKLRYREGTEIKIGSVLCNINNAQTALAGVRGKTYSGGTVLSGSIPRRRRLT